MKKALFKKRKKYISVILVPHSRGRVKVFSFSSLYTKIGALLVLIITIVACTAVITASTLNSNRILKENIKKLYSINAEQRGLLTDKVHEIESLKARDGNVDKTIKEFMDKYRELTDTYINDRAGSVMASRSGDRNEKTFISDINELKDILKSIDAINNSDSGTLSDLSDTEEKLKSYLDTLPTLWPASAAISDKFGYRIDPFTRKKTYHEGLDLATDYGSDVKASASGEVTFSGRSSGYGYAVIIDHGKGLSTLYGHLSKLIAKEGQSVKKGTVIARSGSTGRSTGPHLHFEVRFNGEQVDPLMYLDKK